MGKKSKQKATPPHKSKVLFVNYDRTFDTLVYHIKQNTDERTRLWTLATDGFKTTNERGILIAKHHVPEEGIDGINENAKALRSPAELAAALEYWPHSRLIKDFPSYVPGRWDGRDGRPRGCPGSDCQYDDYYENAVRNHRFPTEVLLVVFTLKGEDGSMADNINLGSFAAPVIMTSDGGMIQRDVEVLKNMPNVSHAGNEVMMKPYSKVNGEEGTDMGIALEIPATYCAREGCAICEHPRKTIVDVGDDHTHGADESCGKFLCKAPKNRMKLMACSLCKTVQYCSKECQKMDWKRHKALCGTEAQPVTSAAAEGVC